MKRKTLFLITAWTLGTAWGQMPQQDINQGYTPGSGQSFTPGGGSLSQPGSGGFSQQNDPSTVDDTYLPPQQQQQDQYYDSEFQNYDYYPDGFDEYDQGYDEYEPGGFDPYNYEQRDQQILDGPFDPMEPVEDF